MSVYVPTFFFVTFYAMHFLFREGGRVRNEIE
jgi:hypothetical protein